MTPKQEFKTPFEELNFYLDPANSNKHKHSYIDWAIESNIYNSSIVTALHPSSKEKHIINRIYMEAKKQKLNPLEAIAEFNYASKTFKQNRTKIIDILIETKTPLINFFLAVKESNSLSIDTKINLTLDLSRSIKNNPYLAADKIKIEIGKPFKSTKLSKAIADMYQDSDNINLFELVQFSNPREMEEKIEQMSNKELHYLILFLRSITTRRLPTIPGSIVELLLLPPKFQKNVTISKSNSGKIRWSDSMINYVVDNISDVYKWICLSPKDKKKFICKSVIYNPYNQARTEYIDLKKTIMVFQSKL